MTAKTLTSELEAINILLASVDEAPVSSLALTGLYPLQKAKDTLSEASLAVQSMGWSFNTEEGFLISPDVDGKVTLPAFTLRFRVDPGQGLDAVARGLTLYNRKTHSTVFSDAVKGTLISLLDWDSLPQAARHYITIRAARTLQGRSPVSDSTYRYTEADEQAAGLALSTEEAETSHHNMLRDSWSVGSVLFDRDLY
ncbi:MAG: hypothetical protein GXC94_02100 [Comamonadaceae bacterium]|nr:hypothetical protein [Comamonadaceae bacterium]